MPPPALGLHPGLSAVLPMGLSPPRLLLPRRYRSGVTPLCSRDKCLYSSCQTLNISTMIQRKYTFNHMMVGEEQLAACDSQNRTFWNAVSSIDAAHPKTTACATEYLQRDRHGRILLRCRFSASEPTVATLLQRAYENHYQSRPITVPNEFLNDLEIE